MTMRVFGAKELRRALKQAGDDLSDLKDTYGEVARIVAGQATATAPHRSGALAASVKPNRAAGKAVVNYGGARVPYAGVIHWGWPAHNVSAQPFASTAAQSTEAQWVETFGIGVQAVLDKVSAH